MTTSMSSSTPPSSAVPLPPINWTHVIFYAVLHAIALAGIGFFSWQAVGVMLLLHWITGSLGICLGYHRLLSHRSFQLPKWLERGFALLGALALQGGPVFWVAGHRQHHAFTEDVHKDPYSSKRGFWWSHVLWVLCPEREFFEPEMYRKHAPDLHRDPFYQILDRYYLLLQVPLGILLYLWGGWSFVIYGIFVRVVLVSHCTWLINSASHYWGYRRFDCNDNSRNLWWAALLTYGEGWHNNHHADPKCAKAGLTWWELDTTYWVIWILKTVGLAKKVRLPDPVH